MFVVLFFPQDYVEPSATDENEDGETTGVVSETSDESAASVPERKVHFQEVGVTEVSSCHTFCVQRVEDGMDC